MPDARDFAAAGRGFLTGFGATTRAGEAKFSRERQFILDEERRAQQEFQNRLSEEAAGRSVRGEERAITGQGMEQERLKLAKGREDRIVRGGKGATAFGMMRTLEKLDRDIASLSGSPEDLKKNRDRIAFATAEKDRYEAAILGQMNKDEDWRQLFGFGPGREARKLIRLPSGQYTLGVVNDEINRGRQTPDQMGVWTVDGREVSPQNPPASFSSATIAAAAGLQLEKVKPEEDRLVRMTGPGGGTIFMRESQIPVGQELFPKPSRIRMVRTGKTMRFMTDAQMRNAGLQGETISWEDSSTGAGTIYRIKTPTGVRFVNKQQANEMALSGEEFENFQPLKPTKVELDDANFWTKIIRRQWEPVGGIGADLQSEFSRPIRLTPNSAQATNAELKLNKIGKTIIWVPRVNEDGTRELLPFDAMIGNEMNAYRRFIPVDSNQRLQRHIQMARANDRFKNYPEHLLVQQYLIAESLGMLPDLATKPGSVEVPEPGIEEEGFQDLEGRPIKEPEVLPERKPVRGGFGALVPRERVLAQATEREKAEFRAWKKKTGGNFKEWLRRISTPDYSQFQLQ